MMEILWVYRIQKKDAEKISEIIKNRLNPIPEFRLRFHREKEKVLIILDICKGEETPYYYVADSVLEAYVRIGNESVKATPEELKRLVLRGKNTSYDSQNSTYIVKTKNHHSVLTDISLRLLCLI